jgi:hypothetical protein
MSTQDSIIEISIKLWVQTKTAFKFWLLSLPLDVHLMNVSLIIMERLSMSYGRASLGENGKTKKDLRAHQVIAR